MIYFSAKMLFETKPLAHSDKSVSTETRIVLILASDETDARSKADTIGKSEAFNYEASDGGMVEVRFLGIGNIYQLLDETIGHGTEIYSESEYRPTRQDQSGN